MVKHCEICGEEFLERDSTTCEECNYEMDRTGTTSEDYGVYEQ